MIDFSGIPKGREDGELAWQLYLKRDVASVAALQEKGRLFSIPLEMLGIWDTVKATTDEDYNDNKLPNCVVAGYHAMAIDERRNFFQVLRWRKNERVNQTWFAGVHSDVGGSYSECGLSDIALHWMIDRASEHGLKFKASSVNALRKDASGKLHDSYQGIWKAFGTRQRYIADSAQIHVSVQQCMAAVAEYQPKNLPDEPDFWG